MGLHILWSGEEQGWLSKLHPCWNVHGLQPLHIHPSIQELKVQASRWLDGLPILLVVKDREELEELILLEPWLLEQRLLLVLPDANPSSLAQGHTLHPRVLFSQPVVPEEVASVLARMATRELEPEGGS
jgi:hypothetical protein